jgi:putative ABC transport system substrate-binding protein
MAKLSTLVTLIGSFLLATFCVAHAQQTKSIPRIGFISSTGTPGIGSPLFDAFRQGLSELGYVEGKNILIESRFGEGRLDRMPALVSELVQQKVDVLVAPNNVVIRAAREATKTIPIVMLSSVDPVSAGYVESFAHPGGNITGLAHLGRDLSAKRVELLKTLLPKLSRISILWDADGPGPTVAFKEYEAAAKGFKLDLQSIDVRGPNPDFAGAFHAAKLENLDAVIVVANPLMGQRAKPVFELATKKNLVTMTEATQYVEAGGLISYGANSADLYRRAASYVVEILKGSKPGDLQIKLPEKFEIFVNLKTAKQIGLGIPQQILVQADKIIR